MIDFALIYQLCVFFFFFQGSGGLRDLHSFPTRRSSDLPERILVVGSAGGRLDHLFGSLLILAADAYADVQVDAQIGAAAVHVIDRKSTRLNSSHRCISYAVFCLKKKKKTRTNHSQPKTQ